MLLIGASKIDYRRLRKLTTLFAILSPVFLIAVLYAGEAIHGARRWIDLGFLTIQPSEFAKLGLIFVLAHYLSEIGSEVKNFATGILLPFFYTLVIGGLIILEPDLGTTVVVFSIFFIMLFTAGARLFHLSLVGLVCAGAGLALIFQEPYRLRRLLTFLDPMADPKG